MPSGNADVIGFRAFWRANAETTRARVDTVLAAALEDGESVEVCTFAALIPNRPAEAALTYLTRKGLVGGLSTAVVHTRAVPLMHIALTTARVLVFTDRPLRLAWADPRAAVSAEPFRNGRSGMDGILRIRRRDGTVTRFHVVGPWLEGARAAAAALAAAM
jgi:hypothetical protein